MRIELGVFDLELAGDVDGWGTWSPFDSRRAFGFLLHATHGDGPLGHTVNLTWRLHSLDSLHCFDRLYRVKRRCCGVRVEQAKGQNLEGRPSGIWVLVKDAFQALACTRIAGGQLSVALQAVL
jgi:hypothetical protein